MYLHGNVLAFFREIMLELYYYHNGYSAYKHCDLGYNGPIIRGGLHGKQINFTVLSRLPFEGIS